jgi:hypothetical protein
MGAADDARRRAALSQSLTLLAACSARPVCGAHCRSPTARNLRCAPASLSCELRLGGKTCGLCMFGLAVSSGESSVRASLEAASKSRRAEGVRGGVRGLTAAQDPVRVEAARARREPLQPLRRRIPRRHRRCERKRRQTEQRRRTRSRSDLDIEGWCNSRQSRAAAARVGSGRLTYGGFTAQAGGSQV